MFNIDFDRLIALLLPTFLRQPVVYAFLHAAIGPLKALYESFSTARAEHNYRLTHDGQVCYLRARLNDRFKSSVGTFEIVSAVRSGEWLYAITEPGKEGETIPIAISEDHSETDGETMPLLSDEALMSEAQNDFIVYVPSDLYYSSLEEIKALVNQYKLITKRATYVAKTT